MFAAGHARVLPARTPGTCRPIARRRDSITGVRQTGRRVRQVPAGAVGFGSGKDGGGQACKQAKQLFMLRGESMFLEVVVAAAHQPESRRASSSEAHHAGHPSTTTPSLPIELEKAQNPQGKTYGKAVMKFVRKLTPEECQRAMQFHAMAKTFAGDGVTPTNSAE